tara:strand:- start:389 stop:613 length:225 start_codon:yes stop_codon:yes gene_type:complete
MPPQDLILFFLFLLLAGGVIAAFYLRRQSGDFKPEPSGDTVFECDACDHFYTDDSDVERSLCPECGRMNSPVQF